MPLIVGFVLQSHRHLPTDVGFPVEGSLAGIDRGNMKCASDPTLKAGSVQKDACVVDESGNGDWLAVVAGFAGGEKTFAHRFVVELHVFWPDSNKCRDNGLHVVIIDEVGAVTAAALHHLGRIGIEYSLAPLAVDASVV